MTELNNGMQEEDLCISCRYISDCDLRDLCPMEKTVRCIEYTIRVDKKKRKENIEVC